MKHIVLPILTFVLMTLSLTGCDWVRKMAGRPTSADIEAIRRKIAADEAAVQAKNDSLAVVAAMRKQAVADSVAALDSFAVSGRYFRKPAELGGIKGDYPAKYAIAVGAFRKVANAQRLSEKFDAEIYSPSVVVSGMGLNIVLVCPANRIKDLYDSYAELRNNPLFPKDAWILVNEKENNER